MAKKPSKAKKIFVAAVKKQTKATPRTKPKAPKKR